ncbi:unnamed protein product [Acanthoscelides obtectus]|nr:unnamed protein product [Acanthoscelides obtectus]CAK1622894.1 hypothetical protein AOBTE_LOCUS1715 [Acanthoscelides obtectus]
MRPKKMKIENSLNGDKSSINILLKNHYGNEWRNLPELEFYKIIDKITQKPRIEQTPKRNTRVKKNNQS